MASSDYWNRVLFSRCFDWFYGDVFIGNRAPGVQLAWNAKPGKHRLCFLVDHARPIGTTVRVTREWSPRWEWMSAHGVTTTLRRAKSLSPTARERRIFTSTRSMPTA